MMVAGSVGLLSLWHRRRAQRLASERLAEMIGAPREAENREAQLVRTVRSFPPRYPWLAPALGVLVAAAAFVAGLPLEVAAAVGVLIGVLAHLIEDHVA